MYRHSVLRNKRLQEHIVKEETQAYINLEVEGQINMILAQMNEEYANIIALEFLWIEQENWWCEYYDSNTFYRLKSKAMDIFLDCLYA